MTTSRLPERKGRSVRLSCRNYPCLLPSLRDPRLHVAAVLLTLQLLGQTVLDFRLSIAQILICLAVGALIEFGVAFLKDRVILWPASGLLTGNSTAFILRVPGTFHGQWWSTHGIWIFIGVVAISMASKYIIRWRGRHIFNPSNLGLVLAFVILGPNYTEPQDLWWIPMGPWMIVTYAILIGGGLLFACAGRFALARLLEPLEGAGGPFRVLGRLGWAAPAALGVSMLLLAALPVSAEMSLHGTEPAPELPDGTVPTLTLTVGSGPDVGSWTVNAAGTALPPSSTGPVSATARVWVLPPIPSVSIPDNVRAFDPSMDQATADRWVHDLVLDLMIESEARRAHDLGLASQGAVPDALAEFTDVINADIAGSKSVEKTYSFDRVQLQLFLPKFSSHARRLIGVTLHGTTTLITRDASVKVISQLTQPYAKSWGLTLPNPRSPLVIANDFTDLTPA